MEPLFLLVGAVEPKNAEKNNGSSLVVEPTHFEKKIKLNLDQLFLGGSLLSPYTPKFHMDPETLPGSEKGNESSKHHFSDFFSV